jgi:hypothetical protein
MPQSASAPSQNHHISGFMIDEHARFGKLGLGGINAVDVVQQNLF